MQETWLLSTKSKRKISQSTEIAHVLFLYDNILFSSNNTMLKNMRIPISIRNPHFASERRPIADEEYFETSHRSLEAFCCKHMRVTVSRWRDKRRIYTRLGRSFDCYFIPVLLISSRNKYSWRLRHSEIPCSELSRRAESRIYLNLILILLQWNTLSY